MADNAEIERDEEVTSVEVSVPAVYEENEWAQVRLAEVDSCVSHLLFSGTSLPDLTFRGRSPMGLAARSVVASSHLLWHSDSGCITCDMLTCCLPNGSARD